MEELLQHLTPELRSKVESGELNVFPGQDPEKPVLRNAKTGALAKGTGLTPKHNDMGQVSKTFSWKRTNSYQDFMEKKLNPDKIDPNDKESLEWWWNRAQEAAMPSPIPVTCPCGCGHEFEVRAGKSDGTLIWRVMERAIGKAMQRQEINIKQEEVLHLLNEGIEINTLIVHDRSPEEIQHRRDVIEGKFLE